jgi:hypothetical protein
VAQIAAPVPATEQSLDHEPSDPGDGPGHLVGLGDLGAGALRLQAVALDDGKDTRIN